MSARSLRPDVRNPLLQLPEFRELVKVLKAHPAVMSAALLFLSAIRRHALTNAQASWKKNKAPMAFYWKVVGVYVGHISRGIK